MTSITITVPGTPISQPRQRHRIAGRGVKQFVQNYTPAADPSNVFKASVRLSAQSAIGDAAPILGPVRVDCDFVFPRPKSMVWKTKPMPRVRHCKKPDADNLAKAVLDALNGITWRDDAQVADARLTKWIAAGDEQPHVRITITPADE